MRKKHIEILLSTLSSHPQPKIQFETYVLDPESASQLLFIAGYLFDDIKDKRIIDLGCGTGILTIGAALLGAKMPIGIDIDKDSIQVAVENTAKIGVNVQYVIGDIEAIHAFFDTTIMNPPFGSWNKGSDVRFLKKALTISPIVYSLHKHNPKNRRFLVNKILSLGGKVDHIYELKIFLSKTYTFHRKKRYMVKGDLYRITGN